MKRLLLFVSAVLFAFAPAQAKPDVQQFLGQLLAVGEQAAQQIDALPSPVEAITTQFNTLKEAYKEEGRAYARELGDMMVERAMTNKKVNRTLDSVRALCWGVVAYITVVSLLLFGMMLRIQSLLGKMQKIQKMQEKKE